MLQIPSHNKPFKSLEKYLSSKSLEFKLIWHLHENAVPNSQDKSFFTLSFQCVLHVFSLYCPSLVVRNEATKKAYGGKQMFFYFSFSEYKEVGRRTV